MRLGGSGTGSASGTSITSLSEGEAVRGGDVLQPVNVPTTSIHAKAPPIFVAVIAPPVRLDNLIRLAPLGANSLA